MFSGPSCSNFQFQRGACAGNDNLGPQLKLQPLSQVAGASNPHPASLSRPSQACQGQDIQEGAASAAKEPNESQSELKPLQPPAPQQQQQHSQQQGIEVGVQIEKYKPAKRQSE
eukprot:1142466-Pelagomonas_calceolata.AAC.2